MLPSLASLQAVQQAHTTVGCLGMKRARTHSARTPPDARCLFDRDTRLLKVRNPWAVMLVKGIKDVDNRTWDLKPEGGFPAWVLVVSSKSNPTREMMADLRDRLESEVPSNTMVLTYDMDPKEYKYGYILGVIKLDGCYDKPPTLSVWHNPPDRAWCVSDAWEFEDPIPLDDDDPFQTQVALAKRPQYHARIEEEIAKLHTKE